MDGFVGQCIPFHSVHRLNERTEEEEQIRQGQAAQSRIQRGHVSRASELTGAALAPKNGATLGELRRHSPQMQLREIPHAVLETQPERALTLDQTIFHSCLQGSPSSVAPGPGGCTNEILRVCLDDAEILSYNGRTSHRRRIGRDFFDLKKMSFPSTHRQMEKVLPQTSSRFRKDLLPHLMACRRGSGHPSPHFLWVERYTLRSTKCW